MEEFTFRRNDLIQVGSTHRRTLKVLPLGKKKQQKVVVGDDLGVVQAFSVKKGEVQNVFKGLPGNEPITCVALGAGATQADKIFVSTGQTIKGLTKKGKEFFRFKSNLTEAIKAIQVHELDIRTVSDFTYNHYRDCKEMNFFKAADIINDLKMVSVSAEGDQNAVLACQDRFVRVLWGSQLYYEAAMEAPVTAVQAYHGTPSSAQKVKAGRPGKQVIYGMDNGVFGQLTLDSDSVKRGWTVSNRSNRGRVQCISTSMDYTKDGIPDIVIGRDDGNIEVYSLSGTGEPKLVFERNIGESISSLEGGFVMSPAQEDLVLASFSGKVIAFSSAGPVDPFAAVDVAAAGANLATMHKRGKAIQAEIEKLREKLDKEKDKSAAAIPEQAPLAGVLGDIRVNDKLVLNPEDGTHTLSLETAMPILMVALQAEVPLDLLLLHNDNNNTDDSNKSNAIIGHTKPDPESGVFTLATYRLQEPRNRIEIRFRTLEGQAGTLQAFIIPRVDPKTSKVCTYRIRPLSLHRRIITANEPDTSAPSSPKEGASVGVKEGGRGGGVAAAAATGEMAKEREGGPPVPMNELRMSGAFSLAEMHTWVAMCLSEVPLHPPSDRARLRFVSTTLGTQLVCEYRQGEGMFRSDNVSTISILKEAVAREATAQRVPITMSFSLDDASVRRFVGLVHPLLQEQLSLAKKAAVVEALREIKMQEEDVSFLDPSFLEVLTNAEQVERAFRAQPQRLELLHGVVKDFFLDWHRCKGRNVKHLLPRLDTLLQNGVDGEDLQAFLEKCQ